MPGKSRRRRGKYSGQTKKKEGRPSRPTSVSQQPAVAQTQQSIPYAEVPSHPAGGPAPTTKLAVGRYPYIATELVTIGILAGIMLVILAVLASVLS